MISIKTIFFCKQRELPFTLALTLFCLIALSCSPGATRSQNAQQPRDARLIKTVPFFPQEQYQCGPSAMASVLSYRGLRITPKEVADQIYSKSARGTLNIDMVLFAERQGMQARQYSGNIEDLKKNIDLSNPLIVFVDYGFFVYQKNHFMVVVGYDSGHVILHSGKDSFKPVPTEDFIQTWKKTNCWTLLIWKDERRQG